MLAKCIEFLQQIIAKREHNSKEIWILGDFNIDYLQRDCPTMILLNNVLKKAGLKQLIEQITRPNKKGGSCIDYIITNSNFVHDAGITDDYITGYHTVYCIRKKDREHHEKEIQTVRDYMKYNHDDFNVLLTNSNLII